MRNYNVVSKCFTIVLSIVLLFGISKSNVFAEEFSIEKTSSPRAIQPITYVLDGGTNSTSNPSSYSSGTGVASFHPATKSMNSFVGWFDAAVGGVEVTSIPTTLDQPVTLYARWSPIGGPTTFTVTYDLTGGVGNIVDPNSYTSGQTATVQNITGASKPGFEFVEWNSAADGTGLSYLPGSFFSVTANTVLYAVWTPMVEPTPASITYDANTGVGSVVDPTVYVVGSQAIVKSSAGLSKPGYTFVGWNTLANGTGFSYAPNSTIIVEGNTVLYAQWMETSPKLPQTGIAYNSFGLFTLVSLSVLAIFKKKF